jgi:hypothetical protein
MVAIVAMVVGGAELGVGTASAAERPASPADKIYSPCNWNGHTPGICAPTTVDTDTFGSEDEQIPAGSVVEITCYWATGTAGPGDDGYWDRIVWSTQHGGISGETWIEDTAVNLGDLRPPEIGMHSC